MNPFSSENCSFCTLKGSVYTSLFKLTMICIWAAKCIGLGSNDFAKMTDKTYSGFDRPTIGQIKEESKTWGLGLMSLRLWTSAAYAASFGSRSSPSPHIWQPFWVRLRRLDGPQQCLVPCVDVNVKGLQRSFESVLEALLLSTNWAFAICEFTKKQLEYARQAWVRHVLPNGPGLSSGAYDLLICSGEYFSVGHLVL